MTTQRNAARTIVKQTIGWTLVVSAILIFCFTLGNFDSLDDLERYSYRTLFTYVYTSFAIVLLATLHYYSAYLPLLTRKRYVQYALACAGIYTLATFVCFAEFIIVNRPSHITQEKIWIVLNRMASAVAIFGVPFVILYTALQEARRARVRRKEIEAASRETSMLLLAKKLEPHFLFNSLNAIYAIAQQEVAVTTVAAIDNISEKLRGLLVPKGEVENYTVSKRKTDSFLFQFAFVWLGLLVFTIGIEGFTELVNRQWHREPLRTMVYQPVMVALVAFTITGHYYLLYKPYFIGKQYRRYLSLLVPFAIAMIVLDVSVDYFLLEVVKIFDGDDESIGRFVIVALARVLTAEAVCAWVYATVSHYRYNRRQRDVALRQQQQDEQRLQQTRVDTESLFALLRDLEAATNRDEAPRTKDAVTELVSLFRYSAEHAGHITVPLAQELEFLQRYIRLQQMRIRQNAGIRVSATIEVNNADAQMAPMLLLPYIENAFKYGISYAATSFIDIGITVEKNSLHCRISNTDHAASKKGRPSAGMGMSDTLKRLELQYEGKFTLESGSENGVYTVQLQLLLS